MRVVSLVPSATETLAAWGVEPIACTRFCERPDLPHVGGTKNPDVDAIVAQQPDVVVVDRQENRREDADALAAAGLDVVVLDVRSIDGLAAELARMARAVGVDVRDVELPDAGPAEAPPPEVAPTQALRVFVPIWRRPWMTIGGRTYGSSILAAVGAVNVYADAPGDDPEIDYPEVDLATVAERRPDLVLVPSEPYSFRDGHVDELATIAPTLRVDGQDLFWWGARTPAAIARLGAQLARQ